MPIVVRSWRYCCGGDGDHDHDDEIMVLIAIMIPHAAGDVVDCDGFDDGAEEDGCEECEDDDDGDDDADDAVLMLMI